MKYFQTQIEKMLYILLAIEVAINVSTALLAYAVISRQGQQIAKQDQTVSELKYIINQHSNTLATIKNEFSESNAHLDCIFQYFTTVGRSSNTTISLTPNEKICNVNINPTSSSGGATSSTKS